MILLQLGKNLFSNFPKVPPILNPLSLLYCQFSKCSQNGSELTALNWLLKQSLSSSILIFQKIIIYFTTALYPLDYQYCDLLAVHYLYMHNREDQAPLFSFPLFLYCAIHSVEGYKRTAALTISSIHFKESLGRMHSKI